MFADIIVDITHEKLDKIFQYRIPSSMEGMLEVGSGYSLRKRKPEDPGICGRVQ